MVNSKEVSLNITNLIGDFVYANNLGIQDGEQLIQINTENFTAGIYLISLSFEDQITTKKIAIIK